ncbi:MAG: Branched-chain amino acid aminotransferase/4-amino-4-deoxychorismate lyase [Frankiales bacterium]|nr:Branched-chain amino acid aminotransferase/4-amino-4-deoxychorismate lyase [Frankiales bacterium]
MSIFRPGYRCRVTYVLLLDGLRRVDATEPVLRADDLGVLRGESVFETIRVAGGKPAFLDAHLRRMRTSAQRIDLALPDGWDALARAACEGVDEGVLRLVCTKGPPPTGFAVVTDIPAETLAAREHGVRVMTLTLGITASQRAAAPWLLGGVKSTSYAGNMATIRHAKAEGCDDAIWVSSDGQLLEAPTATVAVVREGTLLTPPPSVGILAGTTLEAVLALDLVPVTVRPVTAEELHQADEVMLLSSVRGVAPVSWLDGRELGIGPVTRRLRDAFEASLH